MNIMNMLIYNHIFCWLLVLDITRLILCSITNEIILLVKLNINIQILVQYVVNTERQQINATKTLTLDFT